MILKNKLTHESLDISYADFKIKFANEIQVAVNSYIQTENNKPYFKTNKNFEADFYFDLKWNFNHFGNSNWYIERL